MTDERRDGGSWVATFIFSLVLWGGILAAVVVVGHQLALYVHAH